ncbi:MAG: Fic family protein [Pyrinomonadaceae bacterium]
MPDRNKTAKLEALILRLLDKEPEVSIRSIARANGVSEDDDTERKAIRRALISLEKKELITPKGSGRSRVYVRSEPDTSSAQGDDASFKGIELSPESRRLLNYVSQGTNERAPVGYDRAFLRAYEPNKSYYLSPEQRQRLLAVGRVEAVERPAGTYARNILARLLIDLSWNSSRLEGNTYSLLETKRLIELGETASGKDVGEAQMILNHKAAIEYIVESAQDERITSHEICSIHALLSENLLGDPAASGRVRTIAVEIGGSTYVPLENPQVLRECFDLFVEKVNEIDDPFEQSLFSIVHLSYLQAFEDVNKRTARLVANVPLVRENLRPLSFTEVDQAAYVKALLVVYEKADISLIRDLYLWAYHRSSQRYTAIQQAMGEPNLLKLRYRTAIQEIVRSIILEKVPGGRVVTEIRDLIKSHNIPETEREDVFNLVENEFISLHDGNMARFKVRPSEFEAWKLLQ